MDIVRFVQKFYLYGDKPALCYKNNAISYRTLHDNILSVANALKAWGLKTGNFIAIHLENSSDFVTLIFASFLNGLTVVPIAEALGEEEINRIIDKTDCTHLFTSKKVFETLKHPTAFEKNLKEYVVLDNEMSLLNWSTQMISKENEHALTAFLYYFDIKRPALIYFTSGSTGKPKGVVHDYELVLRLGPFYAHRFGYHKEDRVLITATLGYVVGSSIQLIPSLYHGATIVLAEAFEAKSYLKILMREMISYAFLTPSQLTDLLFEANGKDYTNNNLRLFLSGGHRVSVDAIQTFYQVFGKHLTQVWVMTESLNCFLNHNKRKDKIGALGRPFGEVEVCAITEKGEETSVDEIGELCVKTPLLFQGYLDDKETTDKAMLCGFLKTGDLVSRDKDDYYWFKGRKKNIIVCGASNIAPEEVEKALEDYCKLPKTCVMGKPHPKKGEIPIVLCEGENKHISLPDIKQRLKGRLADYKIPCELHFVPHFPTLSSGKINVRQLKEDFLKTLKG